MRYILYFIFCIGFLNSCYSHKKFISDDSTKQLLESHNWIVFTNKNDYKTIDTLILNSNIACFTASEQLKFKGYVDIKFIGNNQIEFTESMFTGLSITPRSYIDESNINKYKIREKKNGDIVLSIKNYFYRKTEYTVVCIEVQSCEYYGASPNRIVKLNLTKPKKH